MARHTRYPAGRDWLPEAFKQLGANTHEYQEPTDEEQIAQWIRMFTDRKISYWSMCEGLRSYYAQIPGEVREIMLFTVTPGNVDMIREKLRPFARRIYS
jgi:hypothetical protein